MSETVRLCATLARTSLVVERRAGEALLVTAPFGAAALLVVPLAVGTDVPLLREVGPGMYWVVMLLFGVLVVLRQSALNTRAQAQALRLAGVPGEVQVLGNALASAALLLGFGVVLAPVAVMLYDPVLRGWPWLGVLLPMLAAGLALLGSLADALLHSLGMRTTLGPLLVVPLALPLLLGATGTLEAAALGRSPLPWVLLMVAVGLVLFLAALFAGRFLEDVA